MDIVIAVARCLVNVLCKEPEKGNEEYVQQQGQAQIPLGTPYTQQPASQPAPASSRPHRRPHNDYLANAQDPHYTSLRKRADAEEDEMRQCAGESHAVYEQGDGARAHDLSEKSHAHRAEAERLDREAAQWIFNKNNEGRDPDEVDLHGLKVKEAIEYTDRAVENARQNGVTELHLIVGKGLHSVDHVAHLKPAIEELMQKHQIVAELDPHNSGVLIAHLGGRGRGIGPEVDSREITRRLGDQETGCAVM